MRWGSLLQVVVLAGAAMAAPQLFKPGGLDAKALAGLVSQLQNQRSGGALDANTQAQLKALQGGQFEGLSLEKLAALGDAARAGGAGGTGGVAGGPDVAGALMKAMNNQVPLHLRFRKEILQGSEWLRRLYDKHRNKVLSFLAVVGLATVVVLFLGLVPVVRLFARFYLTFLYNLSCYWLMYLALVMFVYYFASRLNPWPLLPREFLFAPAGYMLLTGIFIRMLDPNYPLWNTLLKGMGSTILSCAGIALFGLF